MQITISRRTAFVLVLAVLLLLPAVAFGGTVFDDVDDSSTHIDGITFMKDSGVSVGCTPGNYCPGDNVTRAQMATFMYRLSGNDPLTDPSVNAQTLNGFTTGEIAGKVLFDSSDDIADGEGTALTADIEVATDGFLVVMGNAMFTNNTGFDGWHIFCSIAVDGTEVTPANNAESIDDGTSEQCTVTAANPLSAGSHTVTLDWQGGGTGLEAGSGSLWGIWVPFAGAGA